MPLSQQTSIKTLKMILNFGSAVLYYRLETSKNPDAKIKNFRLTHVLVQLHVTIFKKNSGMFTVLIAILTKQNGNISLYTCTFCTVKNEICNFTVHKHLLRYI